MTSIHYRVDTPQLNECPRSLYGRRVGCRFDQNQKLVVGGYISTMCTALRSLYVPVGDHYLELVHVSCPILRKVDHVPFNSDRTTTGVQRQVECDPSPTMHHGDVEVIVLEL